MAKVSLAKHMKERRASLREPFGQIGPFVTISRQFGCYGFSLGLLLMEILNEDAPPRKAWKIYNKEILNRLATETNLAAEFLDEERRSKRRLIVDFFRSLSMERIPSGYEIRNRITMIVQGLAIRGHAIIVGQGGAGATQYLPNGLSVRLEAPEDWRVGQIARREGIGEKKARERIRAIEKERDYLWKIYEDGVACRPAFDIVYDCYHFSLAQIAQQVVLAMKHRGIA
jgi:hypothetical protein